MDSSRMSAVTRLRRRDCLCAELRPSGRRYIEEAGMAGIRRLRPQVEGTIEQELADVCVVFAGKVIEPAVEVLCSTSFLDWLS